MRASANFRVAFHDDLALMLWMVALIQRLVSMFPMSSGKDSPVGKVSVLGHARLLAGTFFLSFDSLKERKRTGVSPVNEALHLLAIYPLCFERPERPTIGKLKLFFTSSSEFLSSNLEIPSFCQINHHSSSQQ